ncbi:MAG: uracil-DNA glycosylase family protein, partial [Muribaculaceae bacterium]|nr:uracil-DNA glycosylase family protein [Muribaculaceae bacterium]
MTEEPLCADAPIETHPWKPYIPQGAEVLVMGTFPPQRKRWAMDFYYPNRTNDFWPMMGLIFLGHRDALLLPGSKDFDLGAIRQLLDDRRVALHDTCRRVRRLAGNASDKYLEVVEPVPLREILAEMPSCRTLATTGEKAAGVIAALTSTPLPRMGEMVT